LTWKASESEVIAGAKKMLKKTGLRAMIVERCGNGVRYGFDEDALPPRNPEGRFSSMHLQSVYHGCSINQPTRLWETSFMCEILNHANAI